MFTHLVISGGGIKGAAIIGALQALYDNNLLNNLQAFIGSSAGALICFLLNIGYTCDELKDIILNINFGNYRETNFSDIFTNWGLDSGNELMKLISAMAKHKNISSTITFEELYQKTDKLLVMTGSELNKNQSLRYNHIDYPNMKILDALRITMSYPIIFYPQRLDDQLLVDGALFAPYPMDYFKDVKTKIGINIHNRHKIDKIEDGEDFMLSIIQCLQERYEIFHLKEYLDDTIIIDIRNIHSMDFNVSKDNKYKMYQIGMEESLKYLNKYNLINNKDSSSEEELLINDES